MSDQLTNIMKHFGMFYMTEESDDLLEDTIEEVVRILNGSK